MTRPPQRAAIWASLWGRSELIVILGIGETASARCLMTPTQLTTYSGRKADRIASSVEKSVTSTSGATSSPWSNSTRSKGGSRMSSRTVQNAPLKLEHLVPKHPRAAEHHDPRSAHKATSIRARRRYPDNHSSIVTAESDLM